MSTQEAIRESIDAFELEDAKFVAGNAAAGTRARKALQELGKLVKIRRLEISDEKAARKNAKES